MLRNVPNFTESMAAEVIATAVMAGRAGRAVASCGVAASAAAVRWSAAWATLVHGRLRL